MDSNCDDMRVGIVGHGAIGSYLVNEILKTPSLSLAFVYDIDKTKTKSIPKRLVLEKIENFYKKKPDLVVEAASQQAAKQLAPLILKHSDLLILSVGAFADKAFEKKTRTLCKKHKILIPSGAIAGLDAIAGVKDKLKTVTLTSTKNPKSLGRKDKRRTLIFSGTAREACKKLPMNINVSATLSLAGIGFDKTKVKVYSDPAVKRNTHEIVAEGSFGDILITTSNLPTPENPKTSALASISAFDTIKRGKPAIVIGYS